MNIQQFLIIIIVMLAALASYNSYRAKNKIYCTFTRKDKTERHKWIKEAKNGERLEFGGGWYYVDTDCITTEALDSGFNMLFPTMARKLRFIWGHKYPVNPKTGTPDAETPEMRKNLDKREDIEALEIGSKQAMGKTGKLGLMGGGMMPIIMALGLVIVIYFVFKLSGKIDMLGKAVNVLQEMMLKK